MQSDPVNQDTTISTPKKRGRPRIRPAGKPDILTPSPGRKSRKIDISKAIQMRVRGNSLTDIADKFNVYPSAVSQALSRVKQLMLNPNEIKSYRDNELGILDSVKCNIIAAASEADTIKKASLLQLTTSFCQLTDKSLLLQGKSTSNINIRSINDHLFNQANELEKQIKALSQDDESTTP